MQSCWVCSTLGCGDGGGVGEDGGGGDDGCGISWTREVGLGL